MAAGVASDCTLAVGVLVPHCVAVFVPAVLLAGAGSPHLPALGVPGQHVAAVDDLVAVHHTGGMSGSLLAAVWPAGQAVGLPEHKSAPAVVVHLGGHCPHHQAEHCYHTMVVSCLGKKRLAAGDGPARLLLIVMEVCCMPVKLLPHLHTV